MAQNWIFEQKSQNFEKFWMCEKMFQFLILHNSVRNGRSTIPKLPLERYCAVQHESGKRGCIGYILSCKIDSKRVVFKILTKILIHSDFSQFYYAFKRVKSAVVLSGVESFAFISKNMLLTSTVDSTTRKALNA